SPDLQCVYSRLRDLRVLRRKNSADADRADHLTVDDHRDTTLHGEDTFHREERSSSTGDRVFQRLGGTLEPDGGPGFPGCDGDARQLRSVAAVQEDQLAGTIHYGNSHVPAITSGLLLSGFGNPFGACQVDRS